MSTTVELCRVKAELAALRARVEVLAEMWESWADGRSTMRIDAFRDAAAELRNALDADA